MLDKCSHSLLRGIVSKAYYDMQLSGATHVSQGGDGAYGGFLQPQCFLQLDMLLPCFLDLLQL